MIFNLLKHGALKLVNKLATEELSGITEILSRTDLTPRHRADFYEKRERSGKNIFFHLTVQISVNNFISFENIKYSEEPFFAPKNVEDRAKKGPCKKTGL